MTKKLTKNSNNYEYFINQRPKLSGYTKNRRTSECLNLVNQIHQVKLSSERQKNNLVKKEKIEKPQSFQKNKSLNNTKPDDQRKIFHPKILTKNSEDEKEILVKLEQIDQEINQNYPDLLINLLRKFHQRAQKVTKQLKKLHGLTLDQPFLPPKNHQCQFCHKKFDKPCSLGGHISKVHAQQKRKQKMTQNNCGQTFKLLF